jgi:AraC-like DNA-binding protein
MLTTSSDIAETWEGLEISLWRLTEGPPVSASGVFNGLVLTIWKVLQGEATLIVGDRKVTGHSGDWLICAPGLHQVIFSEDLHFLSIHLNIESPSNGAEWIGESPLHIYQCESLETATSKLKANTRIQKMISLGEYDPRSVAVPLQEMLAYKQQVLSYSQVILSELKKHQLSFQPPTIHDIRVTQSLTHLSTISLSLPFSRDALAKTVGISASQLDRCWRNELGITPHIYWHRLRLRRACHLLIRQDALIKEIAYEIGFRQTSHFSQWFTKSMQQSPTEYRDRYSSTKH